VDAIVTPAEMGAIDAAAPEPVEVLIGRAGGAVARAALDLLGGSYGRRVVVVAGKGNNGNDGREAARRLTCRGVRCHVIDAADAALAHVMECAGGSDPAGLAVVVAGWEPAVDDLAAAFAQAPRAVLVVVADRALGLGTEVVLWDAAPTTARAAVPTDRDRAHQQGA